MASIGVLTAVAGQCFAFCFILPGVWAGLKDRARWLPGLMLFTPTSIASQTVLGLLDEAKLATSGDELKLQIAVAMATSWVIAAGAARLGYFLYRFKLRQDSRQPVA